MAALSYTTPKKRKRSDLTLAPGKAGGNDSDSDHNLRKSKHIPRLKSSTQATRDLSIVKTSTSLPPQPSYPYSDVTNGDGEERVAEATQLPTPPRISLFSKFGKKAKSGSQTTTPSSSRESQSGPPQSASSFTSPQLSPSPAPTFTPVSIFRSSKPIPVTNLLAKRQTRSATGSLPSAVIPNYAEPSFPSLESSELIADLLGAATSPENPFRGATKSGILKRGNQPGPSTTTPSTPPVKPSGIKLRFNLKGTKTPAKSVSIEDTPSVVLSPDTSSQESKSAYTTPISGVTPSFSSIFDTRYQSSPPGSQSSPGSIPSGSRGSFLSRLSSSEHSHHSSGSFESLCSAENREPTLEHRLLEALQAELGSDFEAEDTDISLLEEIVNKNVDSSDSEFGSDCEIDADIFAEVEAELTADMDTDTSPIPQEWPLSPNLSYALYLVEDQELVGSTEKLYWLKMQAQWAERGGVNNSFLTVLDTEVLHLEGVKLRLEQKLSFIPNLGGVPNGAAIDTDGGQAGAHVQVKTEKPSTTSVRKIAPTFLCESRNGDLVERGRKKGNAQTSRLNSRKPITTAKRGNAAAATLVKLLPI